MSVGVCLVLLALSCLPAASSAQCDELTKPLEDQSQVGHQPHTGQLLFREKISREILQKMHKDAWVLMTKADILLTTNLLLLKKNSFQDLLLLLLKTYKKQDCETFFLLGTKNEVLVSACRLQGSGSSLWARQTVRSAPKS